MTFWGKLRAAFGPTPANEDTTCTNCAFHVPAHTGNRYSGGMTFCGDWCDADYQADQI